MTPGFDAPVPDMVIMSPGNSVSTNGILKPVDVPQGYGVEVIKGQNQLLQSMNHLLLLQFLTLHPIQKTSPSQGLTMSRLSVRLKKPSTVLLLVILRSSVFQNGSSYLSLS
jgi:hypothetical protein